MQGGAGEVDLQRRHTHSKIKYGKAAARRSLPLPSPSRAPRLSDSDDSDDDQSVASQLLGKTMNVPAIDKGKRKQQEEATSRPPRRAQTTSAGSSSSKATSRSVVKAMATKRASVGASPSSSRATSAGKRAATAAAGDEQLEQQEPPVKPTRRSSAPNKTVATSSASPSSPKRARTSATASPAAEAPPPSRTRSTRSSPLKPQAEPMQVDPPPRPASPAPKVAKSAPIDLVTPDSPPPRRKRARTGPSEPTSAPTPPPFPPLVAAAAAGPSSSATSAAVRLHPATSSSPVRAPTRSRTGTPQPFAPSASRPNSPSPLKSPAKDLSKLFEQFKGGAAATRAEQGDGGLKPDARPSGLKRTGSAATSMAPKAKSPDRLSRASSLHPSPDRGLSLSQPNPTLSPSPESSRHGSPARSLGASSSFPQLGSPSRPPTPTKMQSRPLSKNNTLPLGSSVDAGAFAARGIVAAAVGGAAGAGGAKKTYGGARSFKRDVEVERIYGLASTSTSAEAVDAPATPAPTAPTATHTKSSPAPSSSARKSLLPSLPRPPQERRSYAAMRTALGVDEEELLEEEQSQGPSALKSITQLRAKGENARFVDEFSYLVEGLQKGETLAGRRATAIEVLRKMLSKDFVRRLKASGFDERAYNEFRKAEAGEGDRVLDPALAFLVATLARDQRIAEALCRISSTAFGVVKSVNDDAVYDEPICDVLSVLGTMLGRSWAGEEIGKKDVKGLSKGDARTLLSLREVVDQAKLVDEGSLPVTLRSLSLVAISIIASFSPRSLFRPQHLLCTSGALDAVIATFVLETQGLELRMTRYERGLDLLPADGSINLHFIDLCLRVFEASTSATPLAGVILSSHASSLAPSLVHLIHACHILALSSDSSSPEQGRAAMDCLLSGLRMLIDMTTSEPVWSREVAGVKGVVGVLVRLIVTARSGDEVVGGRISEVLEEGEGSEAEGEDGGEGVGGGGERGAQGKKEAAQNTKFDLLCLALGVLTNMVESVEDTKDALRETLLDPNCKEQRKCAISCHCASRTTALHRLTALYLDPLDDFSSELNQSFVHGYSGILLGLVMLDSPPNQDIIIEALADHPEAKAKLVEAMEEFAVLHEEQEKVERGVGGEPEEEEEGEAGDSQRTELDEGEGEVETLERDEGSGGEIAGRIRRMLERVR